MKYHAIACLAIGLAAPGVTGQVVTDTYINRGTQSLAGLPVTFSRVGADGDFTAGITPVVNGQALPAQVDVLRTAPDGSMRHALVSTILPGNLGAGLNQPFDVQWLDQAPPAPAPFVIAWPARFMLKLELQRAGGPLVTTDAGAIMRGSWQTNPDVRLLQNGPIMKEIQIKAVPRDSGGIPDPDLTVFWRIRSFTGESSMRVACAVERTKAYTTGVSRPVLAPFSSVQMTYNNLNDAAPAATLYSEGAFAHADRTRYQIVAWTEGALEQIERRLNMDYLVHGRFVPPYRLTNETTCQYQNLTPAKVDAIYARRPGEDVGGIFGPNCGNYIPDLAGRNDDMRAQGILEAGIIKDNMQQAAFRWDIGPMPAWNLGYLLAGGPRTYERILHADGNGGGSYYIHLRDAAGNPGYDVRTLSAANDPSRGRWIEPWDYGLTSIPEHGHTPLLGYMAYLLTGDVFFGEELSFWASFHIGRNPFGLSVWATEREQAWRLRTVVSAAFILPDSNPLADFYEAEIGVYVQHWQNNVLNQGRPVHFINEYTDVDRRRNYVNCAMTSVWQECFLIWALGDAADRGYSQAAPFRTWLAEHVVKFYTASDEGWVGPDGVTYFYDPRDAIPYSTVTSLWQTSIQQFAGQSTPDTADDKYRVVFGSKIRDLTHPGEIWYYTKLNEDNSYDEAQGLHTFPTPPNDPTNGSWPRWNPGWGHARDNNWTTYPPGATNQVARHRENGSMAIAAALDGGVPGALEAWNVMASVATEDAYFGLEILPRSLYQPAQTGGNLVRMEILPKGRAGAVGNLSSFRVLGHFVDGAGQDFTMDVTSQVSLAAGDPTVAHMINSELWRIDRLGTTLIRATHPSGLRSDSAFLVGTSDPRPQVLLAGWGDSRTYAGVSSTNTARAIVVDAGSDIALVTLGRSGAPILGAFLRDDGLNGDERANDAIFTWTEPSGTTDPPGDTYFDVLAFDMVGASPDRWPYLPIGTPVTVPVSGHPTMPFASEDYGPGPRLRSTGYVDSKATNGVASTITLMAEAGPDPIWRIYCFADRSSAVLPANMNDTGTNGDQFAGDGLWTGQVSITRSNQNYLVDFVPVKNAAPLPLRIGDMYPRFRVHEEP